MSRREEILQQAAEMTRKEKEKPYRPAGMDCEKMPFGCWVWLVILVVGVIALVRKISSGL